MYKKPSPKKRKRDDYNEFLPEAPKDEAAKFGSFEFKEEKDEQVGTLHKSNSSHVCSLNPCRSSKRNRLL